jgi:hypothetical protein
MSTSGTTVIAPAISRSLRATPPRRPSAKNFASTSASAALANSEGCRLSGPKSIQRRDPPRTTPRKST